MNWKCLFGAVGVVLCIALFGFFTAKAFKFDPIGWSEQPYWLIVTDGVAVTVLYLWAIRFYYRQCVLAHKKEIK